MELERKILEYALIKSLEDNQALEKKLETFRQTVQVMKEDREKKAGDGLIMQALRDEIENLQEDNDWLKNELESYKCRVKVLTEENLRLSKEDEVGEPGDYSNMTVEEVVDLLEELGVGAHCGTIKLLQTNEETTPYALRQDLYYRNLKAGSFKIEYMAKGYNNPAFNEKTTGTLLDMLLDRECYQFC